MTLTGCCASTRTSSIMAPMTDQSTYQLGPDDAQLTVHTGTAGPAASMGHDLELTVDSWQATLLVGGDSGKLTLRADGSSLRLTGTSNTRGSSEADAERVKHTIDDRVLKHAQISYESSSVTGPRSSLLVEGTLTILGTSRPLEFKLAIGDDGALSGEATLAHTNWGIKQYSAMAGTLKVADPVTIRVRGRLPAPAQTS